MSARGDFKGVGKLPNSPAKLIATQWNYFNFFLLYFARKFLWYPKGVIVAIET